MSLRFFVIQPSAVALAVSLCAACSDGTTSPPQATDLGTTNPDMPAAPLLAVAGSDFTSGALSTVEPSSRTVRKNVDVIDSQPVARAFGSKLYVLDQTHGSGRIYDATKGFKTPTDFPISKTGTVDGAQANPHDIYVDAARNLAYVSLYGGFGSTQITGQTALAVIDLTNPSAGIKSFIPLTVATGDTDTNPDADRLVACNDTLYVLLQNVDRTKSYAPAGAGRLAVLSLANPGTPSYITLAGQNPIGLTVLPSCAEAIVGSAGNQLTGTLAGMAGIERVNLASAQTMGLALTDMTLGGNVSALDAVDASHVFADVSVKSGTTYNNTVYAVDLVAKTKGAALLGPMSFVAGVRVLDSRLVVLSAGMAGTGQIAPGLYLGPATGVPLTDPALDVGLPPQSVALVYP